MSARTHFCLDCRKRLPEGTPCHRVINTASPKAKSSLNRALIASRRKELVVESLGRSALRTVAKLTFYGLTPVLGVLLGMALTESVVLMVPLVVVAALPLALMNAGASDEGMVGDRREELKERLRLRGAPTKFIAQKQLIEKSQKSELFVGKCTGKSQKSPLGNTCLAYSLELHHSEAKPTTLILRDAHSLELKVELSNGKTLLVPAGEIQLSLEVIRPLPKLGPDSEFKFVHFSFDEVRAAYLQPGDQVEIQAQVSPLFAGQGNTYRESSQQGWLCTGPVVARVLR